jgi:hypothetical protein
LRIGKDAAMILNVKTDDTWSVSFTGQGDTQRPDLWIPIAVPSERIHIEYGNRIESNRERVMSVTVSGRSVSRTISGQRHAQPILRIHKNGNVVFEPMWKMHIQK